MTGTALRILIVDNEHDSANTLAMLLGYMGHKAQACYSGEECLACLDEFRPHAILLDLGMPNLSGFGVAARMREASKDIPLIALTGYGQSTDREQTHAAGFVKHLLKPVSMEQLREALADVHAYADC